MRLTLLDRRRTVRVVLGLCLLALFVLGALGQRIMPAWGSSCPDGGECDPAALRSLVVSAWALHALSVVGLVAGMLAVGRTRPESPHGDGIPDEHAAPPWRHALLAAGFVGVTNAITAAALGVAVIFGGLMVGAVVAAWWVGLTVFLDALDRLARPQSERRGSWWRALAVSTLTVAMLWVVPVLVVGVESKGWSEAFLLADLLVAGVTGVATLGTRLVPGGRREDEHPHRGRLLSATLAGSLLLPLGMALYVDVGGSTWHRAGEIVGDLVNPYPASAVAADDGEATPSPPLTTSPCTVADLTVTAVPGEPTLGGRSAVLRASSISDAPCVLGGYPDLRLADDDGPIPLWTTPADYTVTGEPAEVEAITLAPGESASVTVWWRARPPGDVEDGARVLRVDLGDDASVRGVQTVEVDGPPGLTEGLAAGSRVRIEPWSTGDRLPLP
ncbi:DUF4232 domain-containing protein [Janibacter melonis]|uniref:DUF4232 domain-containing protein n=1 Tax=Janibacter melonis TaxID=262209 RepID=UPI002043762F|nr:DUF4232 domain-containing protein [Janibacter melonis]MCM3556747.1 DUF4232 domain-containing protein [Janibacter melonis]